MTPRPECDNMQTMSRHYREGHEYAVCVACKSHLLIEEELRESLDEPTYTALTCDWEPCRADFDAVVYPVGVPS